MKQSMSPVKFAMISAAMLTALSLMLFITLELVADYEQAQSLGERITA